MPNSIFNDYSAQKQLSEYNDRFSMRRAIFVVVVELYLSHTRFLAMFEVRWMARIKLIFQLLSFAVTRLKFGLNQFSYSFTLVNVTHTYKRTHRTIFHYVTMQTTTFFHFYSYSYAHPSCILCCFI